METNEFEKKVIDEQNVTADTTTPETPEAETSGPLYEDISSGSVSQEENINVENTQPVQQPSQPQYTAQQSTYQYPYPPQNMNAQYQQPQYVDVYRPEGKKKSSSKNVGLIMGAMALALCIGIGGAVIGASFVNNGVNNVPSSAKQETSQSESSKDDTPALQITQASNVETAPTTVQEVAAKVKNSVVEITTETTQYDSFYGQYVAQAAGSGVIISSDGYIITNNHVIEDANTINVRLTNGKNYTAKLIGKDATLDVALLKIEENDLTAATFGDSAKISVGQTAIVIGNPLGELGGTVTDGIISALDREIEIEGKTMNLLQTDAAINPGNSGGGLFDANGNLIAMVVAKSGTTSSGISAEGLGFAIPVNDIIDILSDLKTKGYVSSRGYLGVSLVDVSSQQAMFTYRVDKMGVYVSAVYDDTAAKKAGLEIGDCITKIDDKEISSSSELTSEISRRKAGDKITLTIYRDGETKEIKAVLGEKQLDETTKESSKETRRQNELDGFDDSWF